MARIAVGGFQHETNTFAPTRASLRLFQKADVWPPLSRGEAVVTATAGINLPITGALKELQRAGHQPIPLLWCSANPSAEVTEEAFETIAAMFLEDLSRVAGEVDGLYLDLHGAMVTEHLEDGEGELLRRLREVLGPHKPVVVSLDFHGNVTPAMVEYSSAMVAYRTYPHVDMADTGARSIRLLGDLLDAPPLAKAFQQIPFLMPLTAQCTLNEPMSTLMDHCQRLESDGVASISLLPGFPPADIHDCGPSVLAYDPDPVRARRACEELAGLVLQHEADFAGILYTPEQAVQRAMSLDTHPVVLADTQDNPGGGGDGNTVGLLTALIRHDADAVLAVLTDPPAAARAHQAGIGATLALSLGVPQPHTDEQPVSGHFTVEALGDGSFTGTGPFYLGCRFQLGPMALLRHGRVRVIVSDHKQQAADQAIFRHLGVEPAAQRILALKSSVHFRADFQSMASQVLVVESPGPNLADPGKLAFRRLRPGVRRRPGTISPHG